MTEPSGPETTRLLEKHLAEMKAINAEGSAVFELLLVQYGEFEEKAYSLESRLIGKDAEIARLRAELEALRHERNVLQKICAERSDELDAARKAQRDGWIAVSERLPPDSKPVLVQAFHDDADWQDVAWYNGTTWFSNVSGRGYTPKQRITDWRELPAAPRAQGVDK